MYRWFILLALSANTAAAYDGFQVDSLTRHDYTWVSLEGVADGELIYQSDEDVSRDDTVTNYSGQLEAYTEAAAPESSAYSTIYHELEIGSGTVSDYREVSAAINMGPHDLYGEALSSSVMSLLISVPARSRYGTDLWLEAQAEGEGSEATGFINLLSTQGEYILDESVVSEGARDAAHQNNGWIDAGMYILNISSETTGSAGPGYRSHGFTGSGFGFEAFCPADINYDQEVNRADLTTFQALSSGTFNELADMNGDGSLTSADTFIFMRAYRGGC